MAKKRKTARMPAVPSVAAVRPEWSLGSDFQTVQIVPAAGYWAKYKDGTSYPVVAWAIQARLLLKTELWHWDDDEVPPGFHTRVVGLVMLGKEAVLTEADDGLIGGEDFDGYEFEL